MNISKWMSCLTMTHFCYCDLYDTEKGVCRVSKLVNNTWPVGMIQNWGWEVGEHVPPNILVVCHTVKCAFTLAVCSLHPYDTSYILSWFSTLYVPFHSFCLWAPSVSDLHTSVASKWYSTFFVACFFVCFVLIFIKYSVGGGQLLTCHEMKVSRVLQEPPCVAPLEYGWWHQ